MSTLGRVFGGSIVSEPALGRMLRGVCFLAAPAVLVLGIGKSAALAATPSDAFQGVLLSCCLGVSLVVLGLVVPLALRGDRA